MSGVDDIADRMRQVAHDLLALVEQTGEDSDLRHEATVAARCGEVLTQVRMLQRLVGDRRAQSVRWLLAQGMTYAQVGAAVGVSRQRVEQLAKK